MQKETWKSNLWAYASGLIFGLGLTLAGMVDPQKIVGFLDLFGGAWDPSLAFVMGGALLAYATLFRLVLRRKSPIFSKVFQIPTRKDIDRDLVMGSALFGIGWGLGGFCPGPAVTSLGAGVLPAAAFVLAMLGGMALHNAWRNRPARDCNEFSVLPTVDG